MLFNAKFMRGSLLGAMSLIAGAAQAATFTVDSDTSGPAGAGDCSGTIPGTCTLAAAIAEANGSAGVDIIEFDTGGPIILNNALPAITESLTVSGPITIDATPSAAPDRVRIFQITAAGDYSLVDLTLENALSSANHGAAVTVGPVTGVNLSLSRVTIRDAESQAGNGAALYLPTGNTASLSNCSFSGNTSQNGGAIYSESPLVFTGNTTINDNTATANGGGLYLNNPTGSSSSLVGLTMSGNAAVDGGAIWLRNESSSRDFSISSIDLDANTASGNGAGIYIERGTISLSGSTLRGNSASGSGGGIYLGDNGSAADGAVDLSNVTISGNGAAIGGGIAFDVANSARSTAVHTSIVGNTASTAGMGAGIHTAAPTANLPGAFNKFFTSNLLAQNLASGSVRNCSQALGHSDETFSGYNVADDSSCGFTQDSDAEVTDAKVLALASKGGNAPVLMVHPLAGDSPAVDRANPNTGVTTDQRGANAVDGDKNGSSLRDAGAYEFGGYGVVQFTEASYSVDEDAGTVLLELERFGAANVVVTVLASTADDTATAPDDYIAVSNESRSFGATELGPLELSVAIENDDDVEADERFTVPLTLDAASVAADLGVQQAPVITIVDIEEGEFSIVSDRNDGGTPANHFIDVNEAAGTLNITIQRAEGVDRAVALDYQFTDGEAEAGQDYQVTAGLSGQVEFDDQQASATIAVQIINDDLYEDIDPNDGADDNDPETFTLTISNPSAGALATPTTVTIVIADDDAAETGTLQLSSDAYSVAEGSNLSVTVQRVGGTDKRISVSYALVAGTADAGADYQNTSGTLTFEQGDAVDQTFTVTVNNDTAAEANETFEIQLSNPRVTNTPTVSIAAGDPASATATIVSADPALFKFDATSYDVAEPVSGSETRSVTVVPSQDVNGGPVEITYRFIDGEAVNGVDYVGTDGTLTFNDGDATTTGKAISFSINADAPELAESFQIELEVVSGGGAIEDSNPVTVTIQGSPTITVTQDNFSTDNGAEDGGRIVFVVDRLDGNPAGQVEVDFAITADSATAEDYSVLGAASGKLVWPSGDTEPQELTVNVTSDTLIEGDHQLVLTLSNISGGVFGDRSSATGTIIDDDYAFAFEADTASFDEAAGAVTINVVRLGAGGAGSVDVASADVADGAVAGEDYDAVAQTLSFAAGENSLPVTIQIDDDARQEGPETFELRLSNPQQGIGTPNDPQTMVISITDDDTAGVTVTALDTTVTEGDAAETGSYSVVLSSQPSADVVIAVSPDAQLTVDKASLTFTSGNWDEVQTVTVSAADDSTVEGDHSGSITMSAGSSDGDYNEIAVSGYSADVTDNDATVQFTVSTASVNEDVDGVAQQLTLTVTRTGASNQAASVNFATADGPAMGGAEAGADYVQASGTLDFAIGETSASLTLDSLADRLEEGNETFTVSLDTLSANLVAADPQSVTVTVVDNDVANVMVSPVDSTAEEGGAGDTASYTVVLTSQPTADVVIALTPDAQVSVDAASLTFTAADWNMAQTVTVSAVDDTAVEGDHSGSVSMTASSDDDAYAGIAVAGFTATLTDDDSTAQFSVDAVSVGESGGSVTLSVTRVGSAAAAASVQFSTLDGSAVAGSDYTAASGTLNWAPGESDPQTITVSILSDRIAEPAKSFTVALAGTTGPITVADPGNATVTINDDDTAGFTVTRSDGSNRVAERSNLDRPLGRDSYTIALTSQPTSTVTISLSSNNARLSVLQGSLSFTPANFDQPQTVSFSAVNNAQVDGNVNASIAHAISGDPTYAALSLASETVSVEDNDSLFGFTASAYQVAEDGGSLTVSVERTGATEGAASVQIATVDDTALGGSDYETASTTLNWASGQGGARTFTVQITDDLSAEDLEAFSVGLSNPQNAGDGESRLGAVSEATVEISDNDEAEASQGRSGSMQWLTLLVLLGVPLLRRRKVLMGA